MKLSDRISNVKYKIGIIPGISYSYLSLAVAKHTNKLQEPVKKDQLVNFIQRLEYLREEDILIMQLVADGYTALEIAAMVGLNNRTVEHRILSLRKKLECKSITQLAIILLRAKVIH